MDLFAASENAGSDAIELKEELHTSVVEVGTPVCSDIDEARHEQGLRGKLDRLARQVDLRIAAVSTHPFSRWEDQGITAGPYQEITERFQDTLRANLICGMHVHVCLDDPDEWIAVYNQARYFCLTSLRLLLLSILARPGHRLVFPPG